MKFALTLVLLLSPMLAKADTLCANLTTSGSFGICNGALFLQIMPQPTGSGVIDPFVRISTNNTVEQGFNTDARPYAVNNEAQTTATFDHSELLSVIREVAGGTVINGVSLPGPSTQLYLQLMLDINQTGNSPLLSLDQMAVFFTNTGSDNPSITLDGSGNPILPNLAGSLIYSLDGGALNRWIALNYALNSGSGSGDAFAFIPITLAQIAACGPGCDVTVFSSFGQQGTYSGAGAVQAGVLNSPAGAYTNNDGYEEWSAVLGSAAPAPPPTPEPGTALMALGGLLMVFGSRRYFR